MVTLPKVEIPGLREALKREARVRDTAFLDGLEIVCGVEVFPLSLRRLIWLEQAKNGLVVPCQFETDEEYLAHSLQVVYFCTPQFKIPTSPKVSLWQVFLNGMRQHRFFDRALRSGTPEEIITEVRHWLNDAFMDAPKGGGKNELPGKTYVSYPAAIIDKFGEAGLAITSSEIMDMPLRRLWQHWRLAERRLDGTKLTNPSDELSANVVAGGKA